MVLDGFRENDESSLLSLSLAAEIKAHFLERVKRERGDAGSFEPPMAMWGSITAPHSHRGFIAG